MATKKTKSAPQEARPNMETRFLMSLSPNELERDIKELLTHFDLYDVQHNTCVVNGRLHFMAYVYGKERDAVEIEA